jgi:hypothetical protein
MTAVVTDETDVDAESVFSPPTTEFVLHAVRDLGYEERLSLYKMSGSVGNTTVDVYAFPQLTNTLFGTRWDRLLLEGSKAEIIWVDPDTLVAWLRDVVGDAELADAAARAMDGIESYKGRIDAILPLFRERVAQYRAVLDALDAEDAHEGT